MCISNIIYTCIYLYMYGSNSLKCQASFKKHKYIYIFFAEDRNYSKS